MQSATGRFALSLAYGRTLHKVLFVMSIPRMTEYHNHVSDALILQTTKALAKFVREHGGVQNRFLQEFIALLEAGRFDEAAKHFRKVHYGAYGFNDWLPPVVFEHEDADYVQAVFESLVERWSRLMTTAVGGST